MCVRLLVRNCVKYMCEKVCLYACVFQEDFMHESVTETVCVCEHEYIMCEGYSVFVNRYYIYVSAVHCSREEKKKVVLVMNNAL